MNIAEMVLEASTKAIGTMVHPVYAPESSLEEHLATFTLGLTELAVWDVLNEISFGVGNETFVSYELGNYSPNLKGIYEYCPNSGIVSIARGKINVHVNATSPNEANTQPTSVETENTLATKLQLKTIATLFWVAEAPHENLAEYLKDFKLPDENVKIYIHPAELTYETFQKVLQIMKSAIPKIVNLFMRVLLVRFNPEVTGTLKYNAKNDTTKVSIKLKQKSVTVSEAFLTVNMMPKPKVVSELPIDIKLMKIATLFWLVSRPAVPLHVYQTWFIPPTTDGKFVIDTTKLSRFDTLSIYRLMGKADKVTKDLFMIVEAIRHNPYLKGVFSYTCTGESVVYDVNWTLVEAPKL